MEHFQNESRFSSWAGLVPECKESAGKKMSTRIRKGNKYLMLIAIYHMLKEKVPYCDLGADHYTIINQEKMISPLATAARSLTLEQTDYCSGNRSSTSNCSFI